MTLVLLLLPTLTLSWRCILSRKLFIPPAFSRRRASPSILLFALLSPRLHLAKADPVDTLPGFHRAARPPNAPLTTPLPAPPSPAPPSVRRPAGLCLRALPAPPLTPSPAPGAPGTLHQCSSAPTRSTCPPGRGVGGTLAAASTSAPTFLRRRSIPSPTGAARKGDPVKDPLLLLLHQPVELALNATQIRCND